MAKAQVREHIKLRSTESRHVYHLTKNKRNKPEKLEFKKYDPVVRRHVLYREEK